MSSTPLDRVASLLDDPDEKVAVSAIAELLRREAELGELPGVWQDSPDPLLRKRVHQLQTALTLRRRRREFHRQLEAGKVDFISALIDLHLQWFDNDPRPELEQQFRRFRESVKRPCRTLGDLANFLRKNRFTAETETTLRAENYCFGLILSDKCGAASLLCGIGKFLLDDPDQVEVVRALGEFALCDGRELLIPTRNWQITPSPDARELEFVSPTELLRYAAAMLFSCAVNSDSFRYILTIAQAISGDTGDDILSGFPYPYHG